MERIKGKRSTRRAQNTRTVNEASDFLTSSVNDQGQLTNLRDRLLVSNNELRRINDELDALIPAEEMEAEYITIADYDDQACLHFLLAGKSKHFRLLCVKLRALSLL